MAKKKTSLETLEDAVNEPEVSLPPCDLSMGTDLIDLAIGQKIGGAVGKGRYIWLSGASSSGKSFFTLSVLAEAARNPEYADHDLIYIDAELGASFNVEQFFGKRLAARLIRIEDIRSIERFYDFLDRREKPFVCVLDSFDSLLPESRIKAIAKAAKDREEGKDVDGSYAMEHGKIHSERLRLMVSKLGKTGSLLLAVSQVRDNVGAGLYEKKDKVAGGRALKFWATVAIETAAAGVIKKQINGKDRIIATHVRVKTPEKNRISGKLRDVKVVFIPGYGICNTSSTLEWLVDEKYVPSTSGRIQLPFYEKSYYQEELVQKIEADGKEPELRELLVQSWEDLESKLALPRKSRYDD